jgi:pSer/pThr/pTyr-binding forkhead associated (FHA) protein
MEDVSHLLESAPASAPRLAEPNDFELPSDFFPLRLLLQPGGLSVDLNKPDMVIGRHSQADVRLSLPDVSRRHCRFLFADGTWRVCDLSSLNGIFVNGERLQDATLFHGDRIRIGSLMFEVDLGADIERASPRVLTTLLPREEVRKAS